MYGKIFTSIYDGTLAEDWRALITFQQFIILCDADGMVDMTPQSISRRTGIPIEHIIAGIEVLGKNDKYSRTPDQNGKRIELIDDHRAWGWHIINHEKYKNMRDLDEIRAQTRERVRKHRDKKKCNADVTQCNGVLRYIDIDADIDTNTNKKDQKKRRGKFTPPSIIEVQARINEKGYTVNAESFVAFYESKGWMVGKNKMKKWKSALVTWQNREQKNEKNTNSNQSRTKRVHDELQRLGREDIEKNGFAHTLDDRDFHEV